MHYFLGRTTAHDMTAGVPAFGAHIDDIIGTLDYFHIMLYDHHRMTVGYQCIECRQKRLYIVNVQSGRRLVEYENRRLLFLVAEEVSQFYPLVLSPESVDEVCPILIYPKPTSCKGFKRRTIFFSVVPLLSEKNSTA